MKPSPLIVPFCGVRFNCQKVHDLSRVTAPPYDVISSKLQKELYERDPHNVVRLILGYQSSDDTEKENRYTRSAADFRKWLREGVLVRDPKPAFYLYEQVFEVVGLGSFRRRGFLALRRLEEFDRGKIQPHEKTLAGPKADRLLLMKACQANLSPVFALYSDPKARFTSYLQKYFEQPPLLDFSDPDKVRHRLWRVTDRALFERADQVLGREKIYIADGHHRYETAVSYRDWMRSRSGPSANDAPFHYVMMFFGEMSDPGLVVLPTHRVLQNWKGFDAKKFRADLQPLFDIQTFSSDQKENFLREMKERMTERPTFGFLMRGEDSYHLIRFKKPLERQTIDTTILHHFIFHDLLKMDERAQKDPQYVRFIQNTEEAITFQTDPKVNSVFLLNPPSMGVIKKVFEAGEVLPPKSTFFYPKLLTGLVINLLEA